MAAIEYGQAAAPRVGSIRLAVLSSWVASRGLPLLVGVILVLPLGMLLTNSFKTALLARRAGVPERWGYRADFRSPLLTRAVMRPVAVHQAEYYQHLARALGFASTRSGDSAITSSALS